MERPALQINPFMRRQNLSIQSTFPIKLYQPEEKPKVGQISDKDVQYFLFLVVSIFYLWKRNKITLALSSEREIN